MLSVKVPSRVFPLGYENMTRPWIFPIRKVPSRTLPFGYLKKKIQPLFSQSPFSGLSLHNHSAALLLSVFVLSGVVRFVLEEGRPSALPLAFDPVAGVVFPVELVVVEVVDDSESVGELHLSEAAKAEHHSVVEAGVEVAVV